MIKTTNFTYGEIVEDFNQSHLEKIKIKLSKISASEHLCYVLAQERKPFCSS